MKAAYYEGHQTISVGPCEPVVPGAGQVQIQVSHCGICGTDLHIFHGQMDRRVHMPQVMGHEMSGMIVATGEGVKEYASGDRVTVRPMTQPAMRSLTHCSEGPWTIAEPALLAGPVIRTSARS